MRLQLSILAFILSTSLMAQKHYERMEKIDVQHYQFELELNDQDDRISGTATIDIKFNKDINSFALDLINTKDGKAMNVTSVSVDGRKILYGHESDQVTVQYNGKKGEIKAFAVAYSGVPQTGLVIAKNKYGDRTFFGDNWPNRARHWLPTVDHPSDKATVSWIVTAPSHYQVIGNGRLMEETNISDELTLTHWKSDVVIPTKVMVLGAARFAVQVVDEIQGAPVSSWVYPQDRDNGFYDYAPALSILDWFINHIGPYPYAKLANVQSKTQFGGMENASNIFYFENSVTGERAFETLLAHEIAHQWFGNSASEANWHHVWLSEGFATYFTNIYMEQIHGRNKFVEMVNQQRNEIIAFSKEQLVPVVNIQITDYMKLLNTNSYQKGGWVLHMLRKKLGDEVFWQGIKAYYKKYTLSNALTEDLQAVFESVSGKDLDAFFKQWIYKAGQPNLTVNQAYKKGVLNLLIVQTQSEEFAFPIEIDIVYKDGSTQREVLNVNEKRQAFKISTKEKPANIILDPDSWLLFEGGIQ